MRSDFFPTRRAVLLGGTAALALTGGCAVIPSPSRIEAQNPPAGRFVEARGLRVHYVEMGPPDGVPVAAVLPGEPTAPPRRSPALQLTCT